MTSSGRAEPDRSVAELVELLEQRVRLERRHAYRMHHPDVDLAGDLPLLLRLASAALDTQLDRALARAGSELNLLELEVLRRVRARPSGGGDLAEYLGRSPQRMSAVLSGLEQGGLVEREPAWHDQRVRQARLTDAGLDVADELDACLSSRLDLVVGDLDPVARRALALLLALVLVG
ncbi:winged helix DNA-binding protein [Phycicoccus sp. CSK15P-2]|uniref:MarR family winged helix-turn-helix transcriptional regulator n=1 Tax=Phycicoccus sp. CSK15P-2 TaxID=2807627 RepID=UPI00194F8D84|nr:MarR family transcriptional regulator [Phycicoccus sp. CSK15P-2]MBM6405122.1 winged helix DNA-binding protein [Phycicoccus sp. CSK15P-2]